MRFSAAESHCRRIETVTVSQVFGLSKQPRDELAHTLQARPEHHPPNLIQGLVPRNTKRQGDLNFNFMIVGH